MTTIYFFHGSMSSPQSQKIQHLKTIAENHGFLVDIPDHSSIRSADDRVKAMLNRDDLAIADCILVGSSMGGYVATALSKALKPSGLFLLAPAFFLMGYDETDLNPHAERVSIIHGWNDVFVPVANSIRFAQTHKSTLHILDGEHNLRANMPEIAQLFELFLNN